MAAACAVIPIRTLYVVESDLAALLDSIETVTPDQEAEFLADFGRVLTEAKDKRDRVAQFMAHCESQAELAKAEIARLTERKASFERQLERLEAYVLRVMEDGAISKLEGNSVTLARKKCRPSVLVTDETAVPPTYKTATLSMAGDLVDMVLDALDLDASVKLEWRVSKTAIKAALDQQLEIPGAAFAPTKYRLERK